MSVDNTLSVDSLLAPRTRDEAAALGMAVLPFGVALALPWVVMQARAPNIALITLVTFMVANAAVQQLPAGGLRGFAEVLRGAFNPVVLLLLGMSGQGAAPVWLLAAPVAFVAIASRLEETTRWSEVLLLVGSTGAAVVFGGGSWTHATLGVLTVLGAATLAATVVTEDRIDVQQASVIVLSEQRRHRTVPALDQTNSVDDSRRQVRTGRASQDTGATLDEAQAPDASRDETPTA